jgi:REP element-mobilizing transposase RayT
MTAPRQVLPGRTYLITRRCLLRGFFLRPDKLVNQLFAYVLAVAAKRYGVQVHAFCVLSNHYHLVVTDPDARLPAFQQYLAAFVARAINAHRGRWETFWAPNSYSAVVLPSPDDVIAKTAYTLANPVAAGLVRAGHLWPGLRSRPEAVGTTLHLKRPDHFFDEIGHLPKEVDLPLTIPAGFRSTQAFRSQLQAELSRQELAAHAKNKSFLGVKRVLKQDALSRPRSEEPRRRLSPRIAAVDKWKRIELIGRLKSFLSDYREALATWRKSKGKIKVLFPAGTYLMRVAHGVACASP